jgi:hypothetical protein
LIFEGAQIPFILQTDFTRRTYMLPKLDISLRTCMLAFLTAVLILIVQTGLYSLEVTFLVGDVKLMRGGKSVNIDQGTEVISGDIISTGKKSTVVISYKDGSKIELASKTKIKVGSETVRESDAISVITGAVNGKFKKLAKDSDRKIYTPTTVCSIRGTEFNTTVSDGADSRIEMKEGKLDVSNPYGKISLDESDNADIALKGNPEKAAPGQSTEEWKNKKDEEFNKNPEGAADNYKSYMNKLADNSSKSSSDIKGYDKGLENASAGGKKELEKANSELKNMEGGIEDEMFLNEAAGTSIDGILTRFQNKKKGIFDNFQQIRAESNRVSEQQKKNYEAIKAIREAYKKAYDEIMKKHKENMDKIKGAFDKEKYKPRMQ